MATQQQLICYHCEASNSFYFDDDGDIKCQLCERVQPTYLNPEPIKRLITLVSPPEVPTPKTLARERYRSGNLYRQTRIPHDRRYEESNKGKRQRRIYNDFQSVLRELGKSFTNKEKKA